jgi:uncharacterized protein involved in exopolysaccharide biosynthesis
MTETIQKEISINFRAFFRILWKEKFLFILIVLLFLLSGLYYAFTAREEFISEGRILPEVQSKGGSLSQFAGLASLAGVDLGSIGAGTDAIRPDLYPDVIRSTPFYLELFKTKVRTKNNEELTFEMFYHRYIEENKIKNGSFLKKFPVKENGILILNRLNETRIRNLRQRIAATIDRKSGIITISAKVPDPVAAADVSRFAMDYLTGYVTSYRTEKLRNEVDFLGERVAVSRGKFYTNQEKKARYSDQFQAPTIRLQSADVQRERLESEYRISSSFYNELLKKYEEAKIRLNQETPVFKILDPPVAPNLKSEPKKAVIIMISFLLGSALGLIVALFRKSNYKMIFEKANDL